MIVLYQLEMLLLSELAELTLAILTVLVAGSSHTWIQAVASGAVCGGAVGLGGWKAVHGLNGGLSWTLAAAGWDGVGWRGFQGTVEWWDGKVVLWLWGHTAGVAQDAHHLQRKSRRLLSEKLFLSDTGTMEDIALKTNGQFTIKSVMHNLEYLECRCVLVQKLNLPQLWLVCVNVS